ncbi:hypothetical protein G3435_06395 [Pseudomonas sp. MAFF212428]|nr:hypothetical protein [Pseudomonas brassicae]
MLFRETAVAQALRGLQPSGGNLTFHYLPPPLEGLKKTSAQQSCGLEPGLHRHLPDIPHDWGVYATHLKNRWETTQLRRSASRRETMQIDQPTANFHLVLRDFRAFALERIGGHEIQLEGETFKHPTVQLAFDAFKAGRSYIPGAQLFASIREDSKYHHQIAWCISNGIGHPFPVRFRAALDRYVLEGGAGGAYRLADVDLFVLHDDKLFLVAQGGKINE